MSILISAEDLLARRRVATGALAPLADGLLAELEPLIARPPEVPTQKARLSRAGEADERFRLYGHQLWLAERVLHAALLGVLLDNQQARALAISLLDAYADQYLHYPNRDNVLGPSRPFFSTYLESIWLLQLVLALDLLENHQLSSRVRERLVAPSAELIASYDEGMSNRQVWNNAALAAAGVTLEDNAMVERAIVGKSGLHAHLENALLGDGSWYEGENYHFFAHRGLWYCVHIAERHGYPLPPELERRFNEGFAAPFRTVLPDLTFPSRRDSQYAVSIRQPRFAESCELGLARHDDDRLIGILARLYNSDIPRADTGRARSTADAERNLPATGLTRADLSWRSLLFAREQLPPLIVNELQSDLLPAQGIGVLRRNGGKLYVALDYGHPGGGHGHPDRLNLLLSDGDARWFDDPGTGSYVDPSLHWYRSTLAHTAPFVDGRSQPAVSGRLLAFQDDGEAGWISAVAPLAEDLRVRRTIVLFEDYLVDVLEWDGDSVHEVALPWHGVDLVNGFDEPVARTPQPITGGEKSDDGFGFLGDTALVHAPDGVQPAGLTGRSCQNWQEHAQPCQNWQEHPHRIIGRFAGRVLRGWVLADEGTTWWSARAPDVPTRSGDVPLLLARCSAHNGRYLSVWSWHDAIASVERDGKFVRVVRRDGKPTRELAELFGGMRLAEEETAISHQPSAISELQPATLPATFVLGEENYRRSEESWSEAGRPTAMVTVATMRPDTITVTVDVSQVHRRFVSVDAENPLDNEPVAINGDGVQLYVVAGERKGGWLLVPQAESRDVGVRAIEGWDNGLSVSATWEPTESGYSLDAEVSLQAGATKVALDVIVNETTPERERRRGQLVLSGARGEFVYLRGDRHEIERLLRFNMTNA
jgi:hypothetical protein